MLQREKSSYTLKIDGKPNVLAFARRFDNPDVLQTLGALNTDLREKNKAYFGQMQNGKYTPPSLIILTHGSRIGFAAQREEKMIMEELIRQRGWSTKFIFIDDPDLPVTSVIERPDETLILSNTYSHKVLNKEMAQELENQGAVIVSGIPFLVTEQGRFLSKSYLVDHVIKEHSPKTRVVARTQNAAHQLLQEIDALPDGGYFVKPDGDGGGTGGFRFAKQHDRYIIESPTQLTGEEKQDVIYLDTRSLHDWEKDFLRFLFDYYKKNDLNHYIGSQKLNIEYPRNQFENAKSFNEFSSIVTRAVQAYEQGFKRSYAPCLIQDLVHNAMSLRCHMQHVPGSGLHIQALIMRLGQLNFLPNGIGLGNDGISFIDPRTGKRKAERIRSVPITQEMVALLGGKDNLIHGLSVAQKCIETYVRLNMDEFDLKNKPFRLESDLAWDMRTSQWQIFELNPDGAGGCENSPWEYFVQKAQEFLSFGVNYFSLKKQGV